MKIRLLFLIVTFSFFNTGCKKDNEQKNEEEQNISNINWVETKGKIKFPENYDDSKLGKLEIVAGIHSAEPTKISGKKKISEYEYSIPLVGGGTQLITLLNDDEPLMYGIATLDNEVEVVLDAESTAIALLFLHPFLITYDPENANFVKGKLKQAPSFKDLVSEVESLLQLGSLSNYTPNIDPKSLKSYRFVLTEALATMTENLNLNNSKLELEILEENDEYIEAKIKNSHKRWVSVYANRITNGVSEEIKDIKMIDKDKNELWSSNYFWANSPSFGFIDFVIKKFSQASFTQNSLSFIIDKKSAEKLQIKCFGLGLANGVPSIDSEEFTKGIDATLLTILFDYSFNLWNLYTGANPFEDNGHQLLSGRPNDNPLIPLMTNFVKKLLTDKTILETYYQYQTSDDGDELIELMSGIVQFSYNFLLEDDNAKVFYDLLKKLDVPYDYGFGTKDIKKLIKRVYRMGALISYAETGTNLALALEATYTSDWTTEFIVDLGEPTDNALVYEDFNNECLGKEHGGDYKTKDDRTVLEFSRENESRVVYDFDTQVNKNEGTIEMIVFIENGYRYNDYTLTKDLEETLIFTTDVWRGDVTYPGSTWFRVYDNGKIYLKMATAKYGNKPHQILIAENTNFKFNEWHHIGFSYGDKGQYLFLDDKIVASNPENNQIMGAGGDHNRQLDKPTLGECVSSYWQNNRYEGGFNGYVDQFRTSDKQKDWKLRL